MKKSKLISLWLTVTMFTFITISTIAYSALNTTLTMIEGKATFRPVADIRIVNLEFLSSDNAGYEDYNSNFSKQNIFIGITLPELESSVTYEITVTNFVDITMILEKINNINLNNPSMEYTLTNMNIQSIVSGISTVTFQITFKYKDDILILPENKSLGANIEFVFIPNDKTPPIITEIDNPKTYFLTQTEKIDLTSFATAYDNEDGDITQLIQISSLPEFNKNKPGTYEISYNVRDKAGNNAVTLKIKIVIWNFIKIVNGQYHVLALTNHGQVWTFGYNNVGQRGLGHTSSASLNRAPTLIPQTYFDGLPVIDITAGYFSSFAINSAGQAYGWGEGAGYQFGNGSISNVSRPTKITQPSEITFTQISGFYRTVAAIGNDGNIYTWGESNAWGPTGDGNNTNKRFPTAITTNGNFIQVAQGYYGGAAVTNDGQIYVWGTNQEHQIGTSYPNTYNMPTLIPNLSNIKEVSYGRTSIFAITNSGQVWAWGDNRGNGSLGIGSTTNIYPATLIMGLSNVDKVVAGFDHTLFKSGNNVYGSGKGSYGVLFGGNTIGHNIPTLSTLNNISGNVSYIAGKFDNSYILSIDGTTVYGIGYCDATGQEWGSTVNNTSSTTTAIPWSFTPPDPQ